MKRPIILGVVLFGAVVAISLKPSVLPNPKLTPGAINSDITQDNIYDNICNPNWSTKSIRPPSSYTTTLKQRQLSSGYNIHGDMKMSDYEEDHLVSLELGGSPTDPKNLWPESYNTSPNARDKDRVENYLHKEICAGQITLQEAQDGISKNWVLIYQNMPKTFGTIADEIDLDDN